MNNNPKVLYLFSGKRRNRYKGEIHRDYPDTPFYGMNHLADFGLAAEYKDIQDVIRSEKIINKLPFMWQHILLGKFIKNYDIVFGSSILYNIFFKKFFRIKTKYVLLNISLSNTLCRNKKNKLRYRLIKYFANQFDTIVCLSHFQMDDLVNNYNFDKDKIFFVPLGVDQDFWNPINFINNKNILSVGKDTGRDYGTLFEVAKRLPNEKFIVVCNKFNILNLEVPGNVSVVYSAAIKDLKDIYQSAKMLLLITHSDQYTDSSDCSGQTVLLDAMSSALPIIASSKKYLDDYVQDREEILKVNFYDADDVVSKIKMLDSSSLAGHLGQEARRRVVDNFTSRKMAENLSKIFKKLL